MLWLGTLGGALLLPEWGVAIGAGAGALAAAAVLFLLSWRLLGRTGLAATQESSVALLLVGVMIGTACSAFVSMLLVLASEMQLRGMVFWLLGDLNGATQWGVAWLAWLVALALVWPTARQLDWLARGDAWAATLGVPVVRRRRIALAAAALATGAAVATAGAIGFVGLVVPHALRLIGARAAAILLPASALGGGAFVVLADAVARTVVAPVQLPVGVIAAAVGVPSFLVLLLQGGRRRAAVSRSQDGADGAGRLEVGQTAEGPGAVGRRSFLCARRCAAAGGERPGLAGGRLAGGALAVRAARLRGPSGRMLGRPRPERFGQVVAACRAGRRVRSLGRVDVSIDGKTLDDWKPGALAERRAWCPQFWSDPFPSSVLDTVQLARHRHEAWFFETPEPDDAVRALMARLELAELAAADVRMLSGGERQRVAIATALLQQAPLLLLDEPASHLDLGHQQVLVDVLRGHAANGGAVVVSLHDLNLAWDLADHVVLLDGRGGASAGPRATMMTPTRLGAAFGVAIQQVAVGSQQRFWSGLRPTETSR